MPLMQDGHVELAKLPSPYHEDSKGQFVAPRTDTEKTLAVLWGAALNIREVSVYDNFFELGGHSLLCFNVLSNVEARFGLRLNPRLMLLSTLEQIAATIDRKPSELTAEPRPSPATSDNASKPLLSTRVLKQFGKILGR